MFKSAIIPHMYLLGRFGYSIMQEKPKRFEPMELLCIFEKIYVDKEELFKVINGFSKDKNKKKEYLDIVKELFNCGLFVDLPLGELLRKNVGNFPHDINRDEIYYYIYLKESIDKGFCLIAEESFDVFNEHAIKFFPDKIGYLKNCYKHRDVGLFVVNYLLPNFFLRKENIGDFIEIIKNSPHLNKKVLEIVTMFHGYQILEGEEEKIISIIETDRQKLQKNQKIFLDSGGAEFGLDIIGMTIPIPLGSAKFLISNFIKTKRIQEDRLEWIVYVIALSHFQQEKKIEKEFCIICDTSLSEIKNKSEEECQSILSSALCMSHMVVWLNLKGQRYSSKWSEPL